MRATIIFLVSWFLIGFVSMAVMWISDMRNNEFNENYFDKECVGLSIFVLVMGYISIIILYFACTSEKKYFTKFIYKIANIGVKKAEKSSEK